LDARLTVMNWYSTWIWNGGTGDVVVVGNREPGIRMDPDTKNWKYEWRTVSVSDYTSFETHPQRSSR